MWRNFRLTWRNGCLSGGILPGLVGVSPGLVGVLLFAWSGGLLVERIALHPAWHWRRSALHAIRRSLLNTQTAAQLSHFHPRWRHFRRIFRIFSRSGEIFSGFGADFFQRIWRNFQRVWAGFHRHWRVWSLRKSSNFHRVWRFFCAAYPRFPLFPGGLCKTGGASASCCTDGRNTETYDATTTPLVR